MKVSASSSYSFPRGNYSNLQGHRQQKHFSWSWSGVRMEIMAPSLRYRIRGYSKPRLDREGISNTPPPEIGKINVKDGQEKCCF